MKRISLLLAAFLLMIAVTGCSNTAATTTTTTATTEAQTTQASQTVPAESEEDPLSYTFTQFGKVKITIVGAELTKDEQDEDILRIYYDFTNNSDTASYAYPGLALYYASITQDGKECKSDTFSATQSCAIAEDLNYDCPVQPGLTSRQTMLIKEFDPQGGEVEISCYIMVGSWAYNKNDIKLFTFKVDPKNLMGVPEPLIMDPITNPTYAANLPTSGINDSPLDSEISIDGWELTRGQDGEDVLRVKLTVTNLSEEDAMPMTITNGVEVYQDGLGLQWFHEMDLDECTDEDKAYGEDLPAGETVQCNALFLLRNQNPAEIVIEDLSSSLRLGMIADVGEEAARKKAEEDAAAAAAAEAASAAAKALIGVWDRTDTWPDHITFNADGTGIHDMSVDLYPFTFALEGELLILNYDDGESAEYTVKVDGDNMTLTDSFDETQNFVRAAVGGNDEEQTTTAANVPEETTTTTTTTAAAEVARIPEELVGYWLDVESGENESFTFYADGTGVYTYLDETYTLTYEVDGESINVFFDDGDASSFYWGVEGARLNLYGNGIDWYLDRQ